MLQEMKAAGALKRWISGKKVLALYDATNNSEDPYLVAESLDKVLNRMRFLVDVPAVENPDFAEAVREIVEDKESARETAEKEEAAHDEVEQKEPMQVTAEPEKPVAKKVTAKRSGILNEHEKEIEKMLGEGKTERAIAEAFSVNQSSLHRWITKKGLHTDRQKAERKLVQEPKKSPNSPARCASCQYRNGSGYKESGVCDYIGKTGHMRGCSIAECDKYVKGESLPVLKHLTDLRSE